MVQGHGVDRSVDTASCQERRKGRGEAQNAPGLGEVQRLDAEPVPAQDYPARVTLGDAEREHTFETLHEALSPAVVAFQEHISIAGREEAVSPLLEFATELGVVVDAAVEGYGQPELGLYHRLGAAVGEVNDLQASEGERDGPTGPHSAAVWPAVGHGGAHPGDRPYVGQVSNA